MKKSVKLISTLGLAMLLNVGIVYAESVRRVAANRDTSITAQPNFEHVHSLAMDAAGKALYLGAHTGLYRSEDGGRSWKKVPLSTKHPHLDVMAVAADPRNPNILYIGTHEAGVLKSTDGEQPGRKQITALEDPTFMVLRLIRIKAEGGFGLTMVLRARSRFYRQ